MWDTGMLTGVLAARPDAHPQILGVDETLCEDSFLWGRGRQVEGGSIAPVTGLLLSISAGRRHSALCGGWCCCYKDMCQASWHAGGGGGLLLIVVVVLL